MNEQNEKDKKKKVRLNSEKRFYLFTAIGCALAMVAIVVIAVAVSGGNEVQNVGGVNSSYGSAVENSSTGNNQGDIGGEEPVVKPEGMIMPVESVSVLNEYGFYHNTTLGSYYHHVGMDFAAEAGTNVLAVDEGVVESISRDDLLEGTQIVVAHENGVKSVYRFVDEAESLKVGDRVERGEVIATVAQANGNEYKDGAHLHFEMLVDGENVDPSTYLTMEEK